MAERIKSVTYPFPEPVSPINTAGARIRRLIMKGGTILMIAGYIGGFRESEAIINDNDEHSLNQKNGMVQALNDARYNSARTVHEQGVGVGFTMMGIGILMIGGSVVKDRMEEY